MNLSIVLAAGAGTRMKSKYPKVLKELCGRSMLEHVIEATRRAGIEKNIVVVGKDADLIRQRFPTSDVVFKEQPIGEGQPYGTGFAVMQAISEVRDFDHVVLLCGDAPLITGDSIRQLFEKLSEDSYDAVVMTAIVQSPYGYGRILKNQTGDVVRIVEEKEADDATKKICEINSGVFVFKGRAMKNALKELKNDNSQGEYYVTDLVEILSRNGKRVAALETDDFEQTLGVNSNAQLAYVEKLLRRRIIEEHLSSGVQIHDPDNTYIDVDVVIGRDTKIFPGVLIEKGSTIGEDVILRGATRIVASEIGSGSVVESSVIEHSFIGERVQIGPFTHIRPNSKVKNEVRLGNFVEVKNSTLGEGTKVSHLTYVGDADVGKRVNFGCGSVLVNYDGKEKFRSSIGDDSFIGCNANIVSPVRIANNSYVAAGTTVTKDVEEFELAIERGEQVNVKDWVIRRGLNK